MMTRSALLDRLWRGAEKFALPLEIDRLETLATYVELLMKWNAHIRLVGPREVPEIVDDHVLDALALARAILLQRSERCDRGEPEQIVDVGTGAGLPGVAIAVVLPDWPLVLCEPSEKKSAFLFEMKRSLSLECEVYPFPVKRLMKDRGHTFDHAVTRATFDAAVWAPMGRRLVKASGLIWFMLNAGQKPFSQRAWSWTYTLPSGKSRRIEALSV